MTASLWATVIIVLVIVAGLFVFVYSVFHAERHPDTGRGKAPRRKVTGGIFRGSGGRQVMPRRDAPAEVMTPDADQPDDNGGTP